MGTPQIKWNAIDEATRYEVYLAKSDGTLIYRNNQLLTNQVTAPALADGDYVVWTRAYDASGNPGSWSRRANLTVAAATGSLTTSPVNATDLTVSSRPEFAWMPAAGATSYQISLRHQDGTARNVSSLNGSSWIPTTPLAAGLWQWAVRAVDASGNAGSWSQLRTIEVGGRPTLEPVTSATSAQPTTFRWNAIHGAARYILHVENENRDVVLRNNTVTSNSFTTETPLPAGNYRAWVKVLSNEDPDLGLWSTPINFKVTTNLQTPDTNTLDNVLAELAVVGI